MSKLSIALTQTCSSYAQSHLEDRFSNCRMANKQLAKFLLENPRATDQELIDHVKSVLIPLAEIDNGWIRSFGRSSALHLYLQFIIQWHQNLQSIFAKNRIAVEENELQSLKDALEVATELYVKVHAEKSGTKGSFAAIKTLRRAIVDCKTYIELRKVMVDAIQLTKGERFEGDLKAMTKMFPEKKVELVMEANQLLPEEQKVVGPIMVDQSSLHDPASVKLESESAPQVAERGKLARKESLANEVKGATAKENIDPTLQSQVKKTSDAFTLSQLSKNAHAQRQSLSAEEDEKLETGSTRSVRSYRSSTSSTGSTGSLILSKQIDKEAVINDYLDHIEGSTWSEYERHTLSVLVKFMLPYLDDRGHCDSSQYPSEQAALDAIQSLFKQLLLQLTGVTKSQKLEELIQQTLISDSLPMFNTGKNKRLVKLILTSTEAQEMSREPNPVPNATADGLLAVYALFKNGHIVAKDKAVAKALKAKIDARVPVQNLMPQEPSQARVSRPGL